MPVKQTQILIISISLLLAGNACALLPFQTDASPENLSPEESAMGAPAAPSRAPSSEQAEAVAEQQALEYARIERALANRDLVLGMGMSDVRTVWGEPRDVETAGDPSFGNQKWIYFNGLSSRWSMSSARVVYFEQGRVVGWDTYRP